MTAKKRLYRLSYIYSVRGMIEPIRTAKLTVEQRSMPTAMRVGERLARQCCEMLGDEKFIRLTEIIEGEEVAR